MTANTTAGEDGRDVEVGDIVGGGDEASDQSYSRPRRRRRGMIGFGAEATMQRGRAVSVPSWRVAHRILVPGDIPERGGHMELTSPDFAQKGQIPTLASTITTSGCTPSRNTWNSPPGARSSSCVGPCRTRSSTWPRWWASTPGRGIGREGGEWAGPSAYVDDVPSSSSVPVSLRRRRSRSALRGAKSRWALRNTACTTSATSASASSLGTHDSSTRFGYE